MISLVKIKNFNQVFWIIYNPMFFERLQIADNKENLKGEKRKSSRNYLASHVFFIVQMTHFFQKVVHILI